MRTLHPASAATQKPKSIVRTRTAQRQSVCGSLTARLLQFSVDGLKYPANVLLDRIKLKLAGEGERADELR